MTHFAIALRQGMLQETSHELSAIDGPGQRRFCSGRCVPIRHRRLDAFEDAIVTDRHSKHMGSKGDWFRSGACPLCWSPIAMVAAISRKHKRPVPMRQPESSQHQKRRLRQRNVAILRAFSTMHVDHHALVLRPVEIRRVRESSFGLWSLSRRLNLSVPRRTPPVC